jgi:hypothetical protein
MNRTVPAVLAGLMVVAAATALAVRPDALRTTRAPASVSLAHHWANANGYDEFVEAERNHADRWVAAYAATAAIGTGPAARVAAVPGRWNLLVVAEAWCTDATNSVPHLAWLADAADNLEIRLLTRAQAPALLEAYTLNGESRIPLVVLLDENGAERAVWIERPSTLHALVADWRADPQSAVGAGIRDWYAADGGRSALDEIATLIERAYAEGVVPMQIAGQPPLRQCGE